MDFFKRTWAEIDLDALEGNYRAIRARVPEKTDIMAVVKADAYGHCDRFAARALAALGVGWFGVSNFPAQPRHRRRDPRFGAYAAGKSWRSCCAQHHPDRLLSPLCRRAEL